MKSLILVSVLVLPALALSACGPTTYNIGGAFLDGAKYDKTVTSVVVRGRTWTVARSKERPNNYRATRDNNNLNPYVLPAAQLTPQAVSALQLATGCKVIASSVRQNLSAQYFADMSCPTPAQ